ncbi:phosphoethanolamine transferase [Oleiphilus sp. HI0079]|uniref:phosphoethanolamine transferase n=1 Tax=Oleiphilus sp. HI0079 TaxID=1822254 RepID=UPI0018D45816|nr:phosphoethanolamine transferase [Oleiphilus sp. HI0079]
MKKYNKQILTALLLIFFLIPVWAMVPNLVEQKGMISAVFYTLWTSSLFVLIASFLPARFLFTIILFCTPLSAFEFVHVVEFDGYTTMAAVASFFETNPTESYEFMHAYRFHLLLVVALVFPLLVAVFLLRAKLHLKVGLLAGVVFGLTLIVFFAKTGVDIHRMSGNFTSGFSELGNRLWSHAYPFNYVTKMQRYYSYRETLEASYEIKKDFVFGAKSTRKLGQRPLVLLVIGETSRRVNWQLGGYPRATNPKLSELRNLFFFQDVITSATHTRESIQLALSRATPNDLDRIITEKTLITAFSEAGYKTVWISNQKQGGAIDTPITAIAKEADEQVFTNNEGGFVNVFDEALVPVFDDVLAKYSDEPLFVVIHTMGSHEVYRERYTAEFEIFRPASRGDDYNFSSPNIRERLLNSYDNSILYTDHVLSMLLNSVEATSRIAYALYFSDHGENILDDEHGRFGHGGVVPTRYVADIPLFVWLSDQYIHVRPELEKNLNLNLSKPFSLTELFGTMLDAGGIELPHSNQGLHAIFTPRERYLINTENEPVRYDALE